MSETETRWDAIVVGAGLSGLTAAQRLTTEGHRVLVVDKSRGLGGRVATRRVEGVPVDHGCRYLQPLTPAETQLIELGLAQGWLIPWHPQPFHWAGDAPPERQRVEDPYYVAPAGMTMIAKVLGQGLPLQRQSRITHLSPRPEGWQLTVEAALLNPLVSKTVILALPAAQIAPLLAAAVPLQPALQPLVEQTQAVTFEPVITVMAGYDPDQSLALAGQGATAEGWMVVGQGEAPLRWAGLDSSKRGHFTAPVVVFHSSPALAAAHLDAPNLEPVGEALLARVAPHLGRWLQTPQWLQVHRWRYGLVKQNHPTRVLSHTAVPTLVGCGDWCGGNGVGAAIASGEAAAATIHQWLKANP